MPHSSTLPKNRIIQENVGASNKRRLFKRTSLEKRFYLILTDVVTFTLCVVLGSVVTQWVKAFLRPDFPQLEFSEALRLFPVLFGLPMLLIIIMSEYHGLYSRFRPFWDEYGKFLKIVAAIAGLTTIYLFFSKSFFSRTWLGTTWVLVLFLVPLGRTITKHWMMHRGFWFTPTIIIGSGSNLLESALAMESNILMGFKVVALLDLEQDSIVEKQRTIKDFLSEKEFSFPVFPYTKEARVHFEEQYKPYFVLALESEDYIKHQRLLDQLASTHFSMSIIPPLRGLPLLGTEISPIFRHEVLHLRIRNNLANTSAQILKRVVDLISSTALLLALSPLFLFLFVKIRRDGGPAFFSQERIGKKGNTFNCYKFRSMRTDAEEILDKLLASDKALKKEWEQYHKLRDDPRVTKIGRFIRKTSMDELPQLWNVFKGEMSMVGPRPIRKDERQKYGHQFNYYQSASPGITGLWQISGRNDLDYDTRVYLDTWYVRNWSLWYDFTILYKTIEVVFKNKGAY